jgi:hypothetical protein
MSNLWQGTRPRSSFLPLLLLPLLGACADGASTLVAPKAPAFSRSAGPALYVAPTGTDAGGCTSAPCRTITYAISQAGAGDLISVAAGTYLESVVAPGDAPHEPNVRPAA